MSTSHNKVCSYLDEVSLKKLSSFEAEWIDARLGEIDKYYEDADDYREGVLALIKFEQLEPHEIRILYNGLLPDLVFATFRVRIFRMRVAIARLFHPFENDEYGVSLSPSKSCAWRLLHIYALREILLEALRRTERDMDSSS